VEYVLPFYMIIGLVVAFAWGVVNRTSLRELSFGARWVRLMLVYLGWPIYLARVAFR
jgi:hypothetical protein